MNGNQPPKPAPTAPLPPPKGNQPLPPKAEGAKNKRIVYGCCGAFSCSLLLFLAIMFIFIGVGGTAENAIFSLFGVSGPEVVNLIIALTNLIFGFLVFVVFVVTIIAAFKFGTTKKVEKENRKKAAMMTFASTGILFILIFFWIFAYLYLQSKQLPSQRQVISTDPAVTTNLTAPVTVKFDASRIPIRRGYQILTYHWDFGDGETRTGAFKQTHTYSDKGKTEGRFDVTLTITVRETATGKELSQEFKRIVTVSNEKAEVVINANPDRGEVPLTVKLDGSKSFDPDGEIQEFAWDLDEDNDFDDALSETTEYTFDKVGTFKILLRVTESDSSFSIGEKEIQVLASDEPTAIIEIEDIELTEETKLKTGKSYTFSAASSYSPAGRITKFEWDFGDGSAKKTVRTATYAYATAGTYEIRLLVTDSLGQEKETSLKVKVENPAQAPNAVIKTTPELKDSKVSGIAPFEVEFNASSSSDPDNDIVEYKWDFESDNEFDAFDIKVKHKFETMGKYEVTLEVVDSEKNKDSAQIEIEVLPPGIQALIQAEPVDGEVPLQVKFDASGSSYPNHRIVAYEWDFGDGVNKRADAASISHQYTSIGTFTAKVNAVGDDGAKSEANIQIYVRAISVKACFTMTPDSGNAPLTVIFDPACSTGTVTRYSWDFGGLDNSRDRKPTFTFEQAGTYDIKLEVADNQNVINSFVKKIIVE